MVDYGCEVCKWMLEKGSGLLGNKRDGWCKRYPPVHSGPAAMFPLIRNIEASENFCGEFIKDPKKKVVSSSPDKPVDKPAEKPSDK